MDFSNLDAPQNKIYTVVGARGTGKTPFIRGGTEEQGLAKIFLNKGHSVLVLDTIDHAKYRDVPILHPRDYSKLYNEAPAIYRTLANRTNMKKVMPQIAKVWNSLIVMEDCYKYLDDKFNDDEIAILGDSKQQNNDIVFMHWCWGFVSPDFSRLTNYYVIFKTSDSPEVRSMNLKGCLPECMSAHNLVMSGKKRYVTVDSGI